MKNLIAGLGLVFLTANAFAVEVCTVDIGVKGSVTGSSCTDTNLKPPVWATDHFDRKQLIKEMKEAGFELKAIEGNLKNGSSAMYFIKD